MRGASGGRRAEELELGFGFEFDRVIDTLSEREVDGEGEAGIEARETGRGTLAFTAGDRITCLCLSKLDFS